MNPLIVAIIVHKMRIDVTNGLCPRDCLFVDFAHSLDLLPTIVNQR